MTAGMLHLWAVAPRSAGRSAHTSHLTRVAHRSVQSWVHMSCQEQEARPLASCSERMCAPAQAVVPTVMMSVHMLRLRAEALPWEKHWELVCALTQEAKRSALPSVHTSHPQAEALRLAPLWVSMCSQAEAAPHWAPLWEHSSHQPQAAPQMATLSVHRCALSQVVRLWAVRLASMCLQTVAAHCSERRWAPHSHPCAAEHSLRPLLGRLSPPLCKHQHACG
jgi:hypothetical protein